MIVTVFMYLVYGVVALLTAPLRFFSDVTADSSVVAAVATAKSYISIINPFFPVDTLLIILGLYLVFEGFVFLFKIIMWVMKKIPGIS